MMAPDIVGDEDLEQLLNEVANVYGYDFTEYSKASIKRRINRICLLDKHKSFAELRYKVLNDQSYLSRFIEEVTVNVTEMYRDPFFYKALREKIIPKLGVNPYIKIWLAGCSTGEEVYSISILLHEAKLAHKAIIYATDINPTVLEKAKTGVFAINQMKLYTENYNNSGGSSDFSTYYSANYDHVSFKEYLRKNVIFSTHNLASDRSFNEFQLIICRNVLIYFDKNLQDKVFNLFDASLEKLGYLALGSKETIRFSHLNQTYKQVEKEKIWKKTR
ncbi:protein-glutamate O-methyltransferase CheR [Pedobacter sp. SD-b]|uniref:Protein-glutamate O-methyltransferase CheR n=1 Tax=Pedobacter segetis TaxID=2793069 RepID=A0ABS1BP12_9SPHI|nr:protein-glutamate O-methyltransferase CheR [Pedobacter segetis]MBK0384486.1 protein-glutamate O-methyltransferase CheR [Pedobacter segetis]